MFDFNAIADSGRGADNRDVIWDFDANFADGSVDVIDLSTIDANIQTVGENEAFRFLGAASSGGPGTVYYRIDPNTRLLTIEINADYDAASEMQIVLAGGTELYNSNFIL